MDEHEWLTSGDPARMLSYLTAGWGAQPDGSVRHLPSTSSRAASDRKLRLFACACYRQVLDQLADPRSRQTVKVAERYADGEATEEEFDRAHERYHRLNGCHHSQTWLLTLRCFWVARYLVDEIKRSYPYLSPAIQATLLRDIVGNPWRPACRVGKAFLAAVPSTRGHAELFREEWATPTVLAIARRAYDERDFTALPILADALEEAGCDSENILRHLRGQEKCPTCAVEGGEAYPVGWCPVCDGTEDETNGGWVSLRSPHARGCWALDLILGKE